MLGILTVRLFHPNVPFDIPGLQSITRTQYPRTRLWYVRGGTSDTSYVGVNVYDPARENSSY